MPEDAPVMRVRGMVRRGLRRRPKTAATKTGGNRGQPSMAADENEGETGAARLGRDRNARGTRGPIKNGKSTPPVGRGGL